MIVLLVYKAVGKRLHLLLLFHFLQCRILLGCFGNVVNLCFFLFGLALLLFTILKRLSSAVPCYHCCLGRAMCRRGSGDKYLVITAAVGGQCAGEGLVISDTEVADSLTLHITFLQLEAQEK